MFYYCFFCSLFLFLAVNLNASAYQNAKLAANWILLSGFVLFYVFVINKTQSCLSKLSWLSSGYICDNKHAVEPNTRPQINTSRCRSRCSVAQVSAGPSKAHLRALGHFSNICQSAVGNRFVNLVITCHSAAKAHSCCCHTLSSS